MKTNKTLKWTQLMKAGTIAKDATEACAALCKNADKVDPLLFYILTYFNIRWPN